MRFRSDRDLSDIPDREPFEPRAAAGSSTCDPSDPGGVWGDGGAYGGHDDESFEPELITRVSRSNGELVPIGPGLVHLVGGDISE